MHELFLSPDIEVNWTISDPIEVIEGDGMNVTLRAEAFGVYANPIQIGVVCAPTQVTGVPAGREPFQALTLYIVKMIPTLTSKQ